MTQLCSNTALPVLYELSRQAGKTQHRGRLFIQGEPAARPLRSDWPDPMLLFSNRVEPGVIPFKDYRQHLGSENQYVVMDCRQTVHADAIAALAGTLVSGGVLVVLLPSTLTPFLTRLIKCGPNELRQHLKATNGKPQTCEVPPLLPPNRTFALTARQKKVLDALKAHLSQPEPALLTAPRGRGKSTVLAYLAASTDRKIWICAPSRRQVATFFEHTRQLGIPAQFIAPDALLTSTLVNGQDVLLLDEAASLPRHILDKIISRFPQVKMATTTEGYEGCGRGFVLQFVAALKKRFQCFSHFELSEPQRWSAGDPLEAWLHQALMLPSTEDVPAAKSASKPSYQTAHASELADLELKQCFQLLLDAHYQTSPNDLKLLLDDPTQKLILQWCGAQLTGVIWLSHEGELDDKLSAAVFAGTRRPAGNLLAQSACFYLRDQQAAASRLLRVVRIAVAPALQQQGLGHALINQSLQYAARNNIDALGTSFGLSSELVRFWQKQNFMLVRIGSKPDMVSGRYAGLWYRPLTDVWQDKVKTWSSQLLFHLNWQLLRTPLTPPLVRCLLPLSERVNLQSSESYRNALVKAFADDVLDFESVQPVLSSTFAANLVLPAGLRLACTSPRPLAEIAKQLGFSGRKDYVKYLREICLQFYSPL